jgi:hypothetical protein
MTISTLLIIAPAVVATGAVTSQMLRSTPSPYLFTIRGNLFHLVLGGAAIWSAAPGAGLLVLYAVSLVTPSAVALAIFLAVKAVALDICANRTRYVRLEPKRRVTPAP